MPAIAYPRSTTDTNSDPYGISLVSGFYGPGAWGSWVIALISSWHSILRGERRISYDLIAYLLYTNWAAIDLRLQFNHDKPSLGLITAPIVVCYCGLAHGFSQFMYIGNKDAANDPRSERFMLPIWAATILPSWALFLFALYFGNNEASVRAHVPEPLDADAMIHAFGVAMTIATFATFLMLALMIGGVSGRGKSWTSASPFFSAAFIINIAISLYSMVGYTGVFLAFLFSGAKKPHCWFLKPCTAQSISDWDQAFALLVALVVLVREFGADVYKYVRQRASVFRTRWFPGSDSANWESP